MYDFLLFEQNRTIHAESSSDEEEAKEDFEKQALEAHNAYRKRHGVKSLKFSKKVEHNNNDSHSILH